MRDRHTKHREIRRAIDTAEVKSDHLFLANHCRELRSAYLSEILRRGWTAVMQRIAVPWHRELVWRASTGVAETATGSVANSSLRSSSVKRIILAAAFSPLLLLVLAIYSPSVDEAGNDRLAASANPPDAWPTCKSCP